MVTSLVRADEAFSNEEIVAWLRRRLEDDVLDVIDEFETLTVVVSTDAWVEAHRILKEEPRLAFIMFDSLFGVDAKEDGFDVVSVLYSVEMGRRVLLRCRADGGREEPTVPTVTPLFRGADFHERETWDMFGIEFEGHAGLAPRILTDENFEGWPLRKDFHLATREAKPWPGVKEPVELDEDGNVIEKEVGIGEAVGPMPLDEAMAEQARAANADLLAEEAEAVEAEALAEKAEGHTDIAMHGAADGGTESLEAASDEVEGQMAGIADPEQQRKDAAEHRAQKAKEIAQGGPVTGVGGDEEVPQGDPDAFEAHGSSPAKEAVGADTRGKDEIDVAAARERGELPDEAADDSGVTSENPPVEHSMAEGHGTDETVAAEAEGYRGDEPTESTSSDEVLEDLGVDPDDTADDERSES